MFINNIYKKTANDNAEKRCLCLGFGQKEQRGQNYIVEQQIKKGKNDVTNKKLLREQNKISISGFKKLSEQSIMKEKKMKLSEFKNKQEVVGLDHSNKKFISQSHNQFQNMNEQQNQLRVPISQTSLHLGAFVSPKNIYQRKIVQYIPSQPRSQINYYDTYVPQKRVVSQKLSQFFTNPLNKYQINTILTPQNSVKSSAFIQTFKPMKQQPVLCQQIQESKKSKQGMLSNQSTQFHKQSSYRKQLQKNHNFSFEQSELYLQQSDVFISQIEPMIIIPDKSGFLMDYKSIESINNTILDENSLNVSFTVDQAIIFEKVERNLQNGGGIRYLMCKPAQNRY